MFESALERVRAQRQPEQVPCHSVSCPEPFRAANEDSSRLTVVDEGLLDEFGLEP